MHRRIAVVIALIGGLILSGEGRSWAAASPARIAAAVNGNIVLFRVDGSGSVTLTRGGIDGSPVMSPDGQAVAFLRTPHGEQPAGAPVRRHDIMAALPAAGGTLTVTRFVPGSVLSPGWQGSLAWEPGAPGRALAWVVGQDIFWRRTSGSVRRLLHVGAQVPERGFTRIAWSPDGREIAAALPAPPGSVLPQILRVAVAAPGRGVQRVVTIGFRAGVLGGAAPHGSHPIGAELAFTRDGHHLYFATAWNGVGFGITGVFQVPDTGGTARMVLGTGNGVHGYPPFGPALTEATQFQMSPNGRYMATDPGNRFWITGGVARPYAIAVPRGRSCALTQWTWLPDSSGLAYVTACTVPSTPLVRLTLATVSVTGAWRHTLVTIESRDQKAIDLAPAFRCIACGG